MWSRLLFVLALAGALAAGTVAWLHGRPHQPETPVFTPAANPFPRGIYAVGILESDQASGQNVNLYPEVSGTVVRVRAAEGQVVHRGDVLVELDDSIQRAVHAQQKAQAEAARAQLEALRAQPRREVLAVAQAQVEAARANLATVQQQYEKQRRAHDIDARAVSQDVLDTATNAAAAARASLGVALRQLELTRAGAWSYDIENQRRQLQALENARDASAALLGKYVLRAPADGVVLSVNAADGAFVSPQGTYATYTGGSLPVLVMGARQATLAVRCYVDEILVHRLPDAAHMQARLFVRGTRIDIPLEFVRVQPYVTPKIELSDQRNERVDVRVLPVIFRFRPPAQPLLYPGQLVDVYLAQP